MYNRRMRTHIRPFLMESRTMFRLLAALPLCLSLLSGCGETRHPVRQEKIETPAPELEKVEAADRTMPPSDRGEMPSLPPGHPPMSPMQGGMTGMAAAPRDLKMETPDGWNVIQPKRQDDSGGICPFQAPMTMIGMDGSPSP